MGTLSYAGLIVSDVDRLADFYGGLFDLEEIMSSRSEKYREFLTGGSKLGIIYSGAYAMLNLPERAQDAPVNQILTFDIGDVREVAAKVEEAVKLGARLIKPPFDTHFGQHQAVLLDPDGNAFRISAPVTGA